MAESILMKARQNGIKEYKSMLNSIKDKKLDYDGAVALIRDIEIDSENESKKEDNSLTEQWNAIAINTACKYILNKIKEQEPIE